jgi:hypothetical protein
MKYLKLFESFKYDEYPDVFGDSLLRGVKIDKEEYIDDPKLRNVSIGASMDEDYVSFLKNYKNIGLQDSTKSIHFYLNPTNDQIQYIGWYGNKYKPIPSKDAKFSFNKEMRNGGLGSTWWFMERTLKDLLHMSDEDISKFFSGQYPNDLMYELYTKDKSEFIKKCSEYQKLLIEGGVIGNLTWDDLLDLAKEGTENLQIWTESPVLHKKIETEPKEPRPHKNVPLLTTSDFEDSNDIPDFYKSDFGKKLKRLQNSSSSFDMKREEALRLLKSWKNSFSN